MNRGVRHLMGMAVVAALVGGFARPVAAETPGPPHFPRVRSGSPSIVAAIRDATERSATFRRLVETIDASDGLVYIEEGYCRHGVHACLQLSVVVAGPSRLLRILVDVRKVGRELVGSLGHELQHAVEALSDPAVTDNLTIYFFFQRLAPTGNETFETAAAIRAGFDVLTEVRDWPKGQVLRKSSLVGGGTLVQPPLGCLDIAEHLDLQRDCFASQ